ncbi:MAG: class I SAM-dependent methyltransferase [Bacillota bacterium]|nr:class I SAM-dependent methyltransferase [Bacillota bacterium]
MNQTLDYYNRNAASFNKDTVNVEFGQTQSLFLEYLEGEKILDFGCGSGRDSKYFLEQGYDVTACDGSIEMVKLASAYTGLEVKHMLFSELREDSVYDGIWACSSILHCTYDELTNVFVRMLCAIHVGGVIYTSFKYGDFEGMKNERYFIDFNEAKLDQFLSQFNCVKVEKEWITSDVRPGRQDEKWLNVIIRRIK